VTFAKVEGGDHELPRLDGEKVGDRGDRGGADPEVTEYGWPRDIDGNRAVGRPSPAAAGWVLPSPQVGWQLASLAALAAGLRLVGRAPPLLYFLLYSRNADCGVPARGTR
jgi:hypothetical protein